MIIGTAGVALAPSLNITALNPAAQTGDPEYKVAAYNRAPYKMTPANFIGYVKSRKEYKVITSLSQITADGIYLYNGDVNVSSSVTALQEYRTVLMVDGTITVTSNLVAGGGAGEIRPTAFVADQIEFDASVSRVDGLFIANTVVSGTTANQGLKVNGNLVAQTSLVNNRRWSNANRPSIFIFFWVASNARRGRVKAKQKQ